ncbi:uncharacterized protein JCM10292_006139 [Rhodotorula paludigena]|uniref:uncharacterized protein n=1 Tax=Rhodotorula paludigena TaxID=86838 RepID=UPI00316F6868
MHASLFLSVFAALAPVLSSAAPVAVLNEAMELGNTTLVEETAGPLAALEKRATKACTKVSQCAKLAVPANAQRVCASKKCSWTCKSGYAKSGSKCIAKKVATKAASKSNVVQLAATSSNALSSSGVKSFLGTNTGSIASWYHTNDPKDVTNGHSWCYYPYNDAVPGFAISLKRMLADFGGDAMAARKAYCGLEAVVTAPNGNSVTLYVADAFDDAWVRTPTSMDVIYDSFAGLLGRKTNSKNDVVQGVSWRFTGKRNDQYAFSGVGSG